MQADRLQKSPNPITPSCQYQASNPSSWRFHFCGTSAGESEFLETREHPLSKYKACRAAHPYLELVSSLELPEDLLGSEALEPDIS